MLAVSAHRFGRECFAAGRDRPGGPSPRRWPRPVADEVPLCDGPAANVVTRTRLRRGRRRDRPEGEAQVGLERLRRSSAGYRCLPAAGKRPVGKRSRRDRVARRRRGAGARRAIAGDEIKITGRRRRLPRCRPLVKTRIASLQSGFPCAMVSGRDATRPAGAWKPPLSHRHVRRAVATTRRTRLRRSAGNRSST